MHPLLLQGFADHSTRTVSRMTDDLSETELATVVWWPESGVSPVEFPLESIQPTSWSTGLVVSLLSRHLWNYIIKWISAFTIFLSCQLANYYNRFYVLHSKTNRTLKLSKYRSQHHRLITSALLTQGIRIDYAMTLSKCTGHVCEHCTLRRPQSKHLQKLFHLAVSS